MEHWKTNSVWSPFSKVEHHESNIIVMSNRRVQTKNIYAGYFENCGRSTATGVPEDFWIWWEQSLNFTGNIGISFGSNKWLKWTTVISKIPISSSCVLSQDQWNIRDGWDFSQSSFNCYHRLRMPKEELTFITRPKIHSHSQIFRHGRKHILSATSAQYFR